MLKMLTGLTGTDGKSWTKCLTEGGIIFLHISKSDQIHAAFLKRKESINK